MLQVDEFDYVLPDELIAQTPLSERSASRLMVIDPVLQSIEHRRFRDILEFLRPGDVLVLNNSRVIPARLFAVKADTGGRVELLLTEPAGPFAWRALARPAKRLPVGTRLLFPRPVRSEAEEAQPNGPLQVEDGVFAKVTEAFAEGLRTVQFSFAETALQRFGRAAGSPDFAEADHDRAPAIAHAPAPAMMAFLEQAGRVPLPPYIHEPLADRERYQTVYAQPPGSVAAPTAGLHFTPLLLEAVRRAGVEVDFVTLHVGIGTFRPVSVEAVEAHRMHAERYVVPLQTAVAVNRAKAEGRRIVAVGTTALRTLESAGSSEEVRPGSGSSELFIYPGYTFRVVDALITNFHLPKSTLLMLVSALAGRDFTKRAYQAAVAQRYRFFSFGDAMLITRRCPS